MSKAIPVAMKDELKAQGIWISGTTFHIKPGSDLPVALIEKALNVAPDCTERVSYKIPIFRLGKDFVAISAAKKHIGFHTMSKAIPVAMKDELKAQGIWISGTTFHIKPGHPLATSDLPVED